MDHATRRRDELHKVAVESIAAQMMNNSRNIRLTGADRIMDALQSSDESSLVAQIAAHLRERPAQQERDAIEALEKRIGIGRIESLDTICDKLWDGESQLRRVALKALAQAAPQGDAVAVETLVAHSEDDDPHVRKTVVQGLKTVASPGDILAFETVLTRLEDINGFVREESAKALERLGACPDQEVIGAVLEALMVRIVQDPDWAVRDVASQTHAALQQYLHSQNIDLKRGSRVSFGGGSAAAAPKSQAADATVS